MTVRILTGDCRAVLPTLDAESVDAVITDPPYGLGFMGKGWDTFNPAVVRENMKRDTRSQKRRELYGGKESDAPSPAMAAARYDRRRDSEYEAFMHAAAGEALRVAKPGTHLVAFGGTRTFHRLTCAIEDAGWEIRDCLSYLYGSGFPKSHNGPWGGTALKPGWEPIILARKPLIGTVAANVLAHGTGGLNIDQCRIGRDSVGWGGGAFGASTWKTGLVKNGDARPVAGRWPANVVLDEDVAELVDEQSGESASTRAELTSTPGGIYGAGAGLPSHTGVYGFNDRGGASRFFYTAKASRSERNAGLEGIAERITNPATPPGSKGSHSPRAGANRAGASHNHHPTVKPLDLMQWLCRLVTPKGGLILDPFCGSGTTGRAAVAEGFRFIGIELSEEYAEIARARIAEYAPLFQEYTA